MSQLTSKSCFVTLGNVFDDGSIDGKFFPEAVAAKEYIFKELREDPQQVFYLFRLGEAITAKVSPTIVNLDAEKA